MERRAPSSSSSAAPAASDGPAASSSVPFTPKPSHRKRANKQLSAKQFDKIVKNLSAVKRSARGGHDRSASFSSPADGVEGLDQVLGEEGERRLAPFAEEEGEEDEALTEAVKRANGTTTEIRADGTEVTIQRETEYWLQRSGFDKTLAQGLGKGPDGVALAQIAARGLRGKENAPQDSFLHEASFVFNPLTRRVPAPSPRKQVLEKAQRSRKTSAASVDPLPSSTKARGTAQTSKTSAHTSTSGHVAKAASNDDFAAVRQSIDAVTDSSGPLPLVSAPKEIQEALILEDLLFVLLGIEGQYIQYTSPYQPEDVSCRLRGATFAIDKGLDPSLRDLVERVLPLATFYTSIFAFVEMESSLEFGTVAHALCAAIRDLLKEYEVLVVQLEHQLATSAAFTLQKLWFYVHPTLRSLSFVHAFIMEIAAISHANIFDSDDEDSDESEDDDDDDDDDDDENEDGFGGNGGSLAKQKRELLGLDDVGEDGVIGGIAKGGEILSMLWDRVVRMSGDQGAHTLFTTLFDRAAQPYARIMVRWITTGHLADTYEEFMIMENPRVTRASLESDPTDEYWERRYTLRDETVLEQREQQLQQGLDIDALVDDNGARGVLTGGAKIPAFLEPWKRKILLAGKYLNVVRECGKEVPTELIDDEADVEHEDLPIHMTDENFFRRIESAYQRANTALLHLLLEEHNIIPRLRSMKHYFFLSSSDFFSSFLEAAGRELRKRVDPSHIRDPTIMRLQTHLGMVLGSSSSVGFADPFREDVKIDLAHENAYDQLKRIADIKGGVEAARAQAKLAQQKNKEMIPLTDLLQFDITVRFPVSLVISKKNVLRWQFLQRPIIHLKIMEQSLCKVWLEHQDDSWRAVEKRHPDLQQWKMRIFRLRHRMLFFVQQVLAFVTAEVLEPNWRDLEEKMEKSKTVDQFMKDHFNFLNTCRKECMLTDLRYVEMLSKLMHTATLFCTYKVMIRDQLALEQASGKKQLESPGSILEGNRPKMSADVLTYLHKLEKSWESRLRTFKDIVALLSTTDNPAALPLSYRLQSA